MISNLALEASAGSGKTYALSVRYISLMYLGAKPNKILTLTFTNKAALEMKMRIFNTLKNLENSSELESISLLTKISKGDLLKNQKRILNNFLSSELKISTIDSFFSSILRKFSFNIGLMPDFSIEDEFINDEKIERFLKNCKNELLYKSLVLFALNEKKKLNDIFVLFRILYEKQSEIDLSNFASNLNNFYPNEKDVIEVMDEIRLRFIENGIGESALKTLMVNSVKKLLEKKFLAREDFNYWSYKKFADMKINALHVELKQKLFVYVRAKEAYLIKEISKLYNTFQKAINEEVKKRSTLSFLEMTNKLYTILQDEISKDFLYFRMDGGFTHLLIDEFQDTSIVQYKIIEPFMQEIVSGLGVSENRSLFLVGDTKQSIYRFRGGSKELFSYAANSLHLQNGILDTNYRSSLSIVNFINETFSNNIKDYKIQKAHKQCVEGFAKVVSSIDLENDLILNIKNLLQSGIRQSDIAVLCFTNKEALILKETIKEQVAGSKVTMEAKQKLIKIPIISGIIDFIHYLYFKDEIYLKNFEVACGKSLNSHENWNFDINSEVFELVVDIVENFDIFYEEDDLLLFIELCFGFKDIEDFIFNYSKLTQSSISKDSEGIRVLTIHKSKGLEFSNVLVVDRLKRPKNSTETLMFEYDDIQLKNIFLKVKGRENFDKDFARAKEKEKEKEREDLVNTQYVAFTRAKDNLFVFTKEKNSAFVNLELLPQERGLLYVKKHSTKEKVKNAKYFMPKRFGLQEKNKNDKVDIKMNDFYSINFGLALHYMLEMMGDFNEKSLKNASVVLKNRYSVILSEVDLLEIELRVKRLTKHKKFLELLCDGKIYKEQPICYELQRKQLDLLIEKKDKIIVVDYKSSKFLQSLHVKQVSLYQKALEKIYGKKCEAYLCYLKQDNCEIINLGGFGG